MPLDSPSSLSDPDTHAGPRPYGGRTGSSFNASQDRACDAGARPGPGRAGRVRSFLGECLVLSGFLLASLVYYFPLTLDLGGRTLANRMDIYLFIWDLWWVRLATLTSGISLFHTDFLFHPQGTGLVFHTLAPLNGLISLPFQAIGGLLFAFNVLTLLATALSGYCTYLLARELFGTRLGRLPALLAGTAFGFCTARWISTIHGHQSLASSWWIPLYLLFLARLLRHGRRRDALLAGAAAAAILYTDYQLFVFAIYWSGLLLVPLWPEIELRRRWRGLLAGALLLLLVFLALTSPILAGAAGQRQGTVLRFPAGEARGFSMSLGALFYDFPSRHFWQPGGWASHGPIFGWSLALVALVGLALPPRRGGGWRYLLWWLPPLFFAWMALGPHPTFLGHPFPGLYNRFHSLPVLGSLRAVYRFTIPMTLGVALVAAASLRGWLEALRAGARQPRGGSPRPGRILLALIPLLPLLVFLEFLRIPVPVQRLPQPPDLYRSPAFQQRFAGRAVLELPLWISGGDFHYGREAREHLYYQTVHGLPLVGGHQSRLAETAMRYFTSRPGLMRLTEPKAEGYTAEEGEDLRRVVEEFGVGVIDLNRAYYSPAEEAALVAFLGSWLDLEPLDSDPRFLTWAVRGGERDFR